MIQSIVILICCLLGPCLLRAQYFNSYGVSAETAQRAGIYSVSSTNASDALALNPAGLGTLQAPVFDLSLNGIGARGSFTNASNNASPMATNRALVPFGAAGVPLGKNWVIGVGAMPDLLSASKWNYSDTPGFAGTTYGPQREKSQIIAYRVAAGIAYRFSDRLSAGFSESVDYNSNTLDAPYIFQSHPVLAGLKTLLDLHTTGYGWSSSFGVTARPTNRLDLGVAFRTPTSITSHGSATGNIGAEFAALGLNAQPTFGYQAQVHVQLPPSAIVSLGWKASHSVRLDLQSDWAGWHSSFNNLPVTLTQGTNGDINSLLKSNGIKDTVPLAWKDQFTIRGAVERSFGERTSISAGYLHGNNPVPNSTLSPLTAAIMQNGISTGLSWRVGSVRFGAAYGFDFTAKEQVTNSALLYDEYNNSQTKIGTQSFTLSAGFTL